MRMFRLIGLFLTMCVYISAQTATQGIVTTINSKHPLQNCNVFIKGTDIGTITDIDGYFEVSQKIDNTFELVISHIGYYSKTINVNPNDSNKHLLQIVLNPTILDGDLVTVTGTRSERRLIEVPGRLEVITKDHISKLPVQNLDDIINYISGLNVHRTSGIFEIRPVVSLRGVSGDEPGRTLVLINNLPINKSDTGVANWNRIDVSNIDQIEIFKGAGSSLYGNNAMGGVINIITENPSSDFSGNFSLSSGTYNTNILDFHANSNIVENINLKFGSFIRKSDGFIDMPDSSITEYTVPLFLDEIGVSIGLCSNIDSTTSLSLDYSYYDDKRGEGYKIQQENGKHRQFNTNYFTGTLTKKFGKTKHQLNSFVQKEDYLRVVEGIKRDSYYQYDVSSERIDMGSYYNFNYDLNDNTSLTFGTEAKLGIVDGGDFYSTSSDTILNKGKLSSIASYLQYEFGIFKNSLRVISSLRMDYVKYFDGYFDANSEFSPFHQFNGDITSNSWSSLNPRVALRYMSSKQFSLYSSFSSGFRAATLDDLSRTGWMRLGPKIANPNLGPEKIYNLEFGFDYSPLYKIKISPSLYYSKGKDFLYYVDTGDSIGRRSIYIRENITEVDIQGAECDLVYKPNKQLSFFGNYTYHKSVITSFTKNEDLEGKFLVYTPLNQLKAVVQYTNKILNTNIGIVYKDEQFINDDNTDKIDGYWMLNGQISKNIINNISLALDVQNVTDVRITEHSERRSPGRIFNINVSYKW